jgi:glycosyltransferase involved in cell wall biosynthesis
VEAEMKIRFSVVLPVYNREEYARQAIDSVLSQTFTNYELIVVDDGSTDRTPELLKSYGIRIRVIRQQNQGAAIARNTGAAVAQGEYIALLDSDDHLFPSALATYDRVIRTFDSPPLIIGSQLIYREGESIPVQPQATGPIKVLKFEDYLSKTVSLGWICTMYVIQKSTYDEIGGFRNNDSQTYFGEGMDFILRLGTRGPCIIIQKPHTFAYRLHDANSLWSWNHHADGMFGLVRAERKGQYPGGRKRRWDRYALIGGVSSTYAVDYCWRGGARKVALRLLFGTVPMILAAAWKRYLRYFRKPPQPIILPEQ